jgi:D-3-phosphoglycerate dehydrogenase / 2-oxoglutarate reductase
MKTLGCDTAEISDSFVRESGIEMLPLSELLEHSDFVSLHCDLNPTSFHLMGRDQLQLMKSSAYLINTSRGSVVDEAALAVALHNQWITGAALDVFEIEPLPTASPLRALDNCLLAPHNSNSSPAARRRVDEATVTNLLRGLRESKRCMPGRN